MLSELGKIADVRQIKPFHSQIFIEPLERGFGHTLGNALRRVMMSSIHGFAVTSVKIDGVVHEYDRLPGMREDVINLLLNLKTVVFKVEEADSIIATLKKTGPSVVTAGDIQIPHNATIANKDTVLCTLTDKGELDMEIVVQRGVGYEAAAVRDNKDSRFGAIQIDALYSPVRRVSFQVENARVGNRTDLDRLILDMETNGTFDAEEIIGRAADILIQQLSTFANGDAVIESKAGAIEATGSMSGSAMNPALSSEIDTLGLTARSYNCLRQVRIRYIGDLVQKSEKDLLGTPHLGRKSLTEIKQVLHTMDLELGMQLPNWSPPK